MLPEEEDEEEDEDDEDDDECVFEVCCAMTIG